MKYADRILCISQSLPRQLFDLANRYTDSIDLTLGDPDIIPPKNIRDAACQAIQEGKTRYSANAGLYQVRKKIADFNSKLYGIAIKAENIMLTIGGMEAIYLSLSCLVSPGDEVIIPAPYWVNYMHMIKICGGIPIIVPTQEENGFIIRIEQLEKATTSKTKIIILNYPNNPTGSILPAEVLRQIARWAQKNQITVISDEVYQSLIYENRSHNSTFSLPHMQEQTIVIDSMSKHFSMTGWRLGYAIAPADFVTNMAKLQENIAACAPLPSQYAALEAYNGLIDYSSILAEFSSRRELVMRTVSSIPELHLHGIDSTFYAFINIKKIKLNSFEFAMKLFQEQHVAVVPGRTYGEMYDHYIRIAFTLKKDKLQEGLERLRIFVKNLK